MTSFSAPETSESLTPRARRSTLLIAGVVLGVVTGCTPHRVDAPWPLATVGGREITRADVERAVLDRHGGRPALLGMVRKALFEMEAERQGITIHPEEVERLVEGELVAALENLGSTRQRQEEVLRSRGLVLEDIRDQLRPEVRTQLLLEKVVHSLRTVTDEQVLEAYQETYARRRARVSHVFVPFEAPRPVPEAAATRARTRAGALREEIRDGADFATVAREASGHPVTARLGGEIGWIHEESFADTTLMEAVFALEPGRVSEPVLETGFGYHIFLLHEYDESRPIEAVKAELESMILEKPPTPEEISAVEELLRRKTPVIIHD